MRIMGLDIGTKTIGIALSDEFGWTAQPLTTLKRTNIRSDIKELIGIIKDHSVQKAVVGLPVNMDGSLGFRAASVLKFVDRLKTETGVPVVTWDERLSTAAVERVLISGDVTRRKRKEAVDKMAASYILQGYLDSIRISHNA